MADEAVSGPVGEDGVRLPFSVDDVPREEYSHGTRFGTRFRQLGEYGGCSHVGVCMEEIAPGRQAYVAHYHMLEEEQLLVLEGRPTLRQGDKTFDLEPGSYVVFPAGQKAGQGAAPGDGRPDTAHGAGGVRQRAVERGRRERQRRVGARRW